jgi:perosamine synthetase
MTSLHQHAGERLAVLGGEPVVRDVPAFVWPPVTEADGQDIARMAVAGELSYYGREGRAHELEQKFADYLPARHCLATNSGTNALHSAYFGLGLQPGDEVLAPTYTFFATVMPLFPTNAVPVLVDIDRRTGNLDPADLERHVTDRTRAIVVVHLWGNPVDMDAVLEIARRHRLRVVEDCSHAHGASYAGRKVGTFGDVAVFSLQGKKLVAAGQGGLLATDDDEIFERAVLLGHFNVRSFQDVRSPQYAPYSYEGMGLNYRIHPLAAAIAGHQFDRLESYLEGRQRNLAHLSALLDDVPGISPPQSGPRVDRHAWYSYKPSYRPAELGGLPIADYVRAVQAEGVPLTHYDSPPLHLLPTFGERTPPFRSHGEPDAFSPPGRRRSYRAGDFPGAETYVADLLSMPAYTEDVRPALDTFAAALRKVARHADKLHDWPVTTAAR